MKSTRHDGANRMSSQTRQKGTPQKAAEQKSSDRSGGELNPAELALDKGARRLRFSREFEQVFRVRHFRQSIVSMRWALGLGIVIYMLFGLVDLEIPMPERLYAEIIRYGIVTPYLILLVLLSFSWH